MPQYLTKKDKLQWYKTHYYLRIYHGKELFNYGSWIQKQSTHSGQSNNFNLNVITEKPVRELKVCKLTHESCFVLLEKFLLLIRDWFQFCIWLCGGANFSTAQWNINKSSYFVKFKTSAGHRHTGWPQSMHNIENILVKIDSVRSAYFLLNVRSSNAKQIRL